MKAYQQNSPEAMARILAMMMIADAKLDDRERRPQLRQIVAGWS